MLKVYFFLAYRNILHRPLRALLGMLAVTAAVAVTLFVMMMANGLTNGIAAAVEPFDMIVGAKGSPNQLVLNTVFLKDTPVGNISHDFLDKFSSDARVAEAVPMGFGDNYNGWRIVGTNDEFFRHSVTNGGEPWLKFAEGQQFSTERDAVIGAGVVAGSGLKIGDKFKTSHGQIAGLDEHEDGEFTVVGILEPLGGPYDGAIIVPIESLWDIHAHGEEEHVGDEEGDEHEESGEFTAILIKPRGYAEALQIYSAYMNDRDIQIVFPSQVVSVLFSVLGDAGKILSAAGYAVIIGSIVTLALLLYWAALARTRSNALLRVVGAKRCDILLCGLLEGAATVFAGIIGGTGAAFLLTYLAGALLKDGAYVYLNKAFGVSEFIVLCALIPICLVAVAVPALIVSRQEIAKSLHDGM